MKFRKGDIFESDCRYHVVPTNGVVKNNGELVMGKGLAKQFVNRYPELPEILGRNVKKFGNIPFFVDFGDKTVVSFPTKHHYNDSSDIELIESSANFVAMRIPQNECVAIPQVGCGLGGLDWADVEPVLNDVLDDRFVVYSRNI